MPDKMQPDKIQNDPKEPRKQDTSVKVSHAQPGGQTNTATGAEPAGGPPYLEKKQGKK